MTNNIVNFFPDKTDSDFLYKIYKKREYQLYKIQQKDKINNYKDLKKIRDKTCIKSIYDYKLLPQQNFLSNFINPTTPYNGILIFHGTGVGKTCASIQIAERFKEQVIKYNTKIYIVLPGPTLEKNFKDELIGPCTNNIYYSQNTDYLNKSDKKKANLKIYEYYEIITYKKLLRKVLGEKIRDTNKEYKKDENGNILRDISANRIISLSNTIIIVDEAHHLSDNDYGRSLKKIINNKKSENLKVVLLTATPMRNLASDIIFLLNLIRPKNDPIIKEKIFLPNVTNSYNIQVRPGGLEYFKKMIKGYVSYLRGADPVTFAIRNDIGKISKFNQFTKLIKCKLSQIQEKTYLSYQKNNVIDPLSIKLINISNIVLPDLGRTHKISARSGNMDFEKIKITLKTNYYKLNVAIGKLINKKYDNYLVLNSNKLSGKLFKLENLIYFSTKYVTVLNNINNNIVGKNNPGISFIYSRFITLGINLLEEILNQNGYINYQDTIKNYKHVRCYYCGVIQKKHSNIKHEYYPSTYLSITGEKEFEVDEDKKNIINTVFNKSSNSTGRYIKILLGSSVLTEGISFKNMKDVHILEAQYTLTNIDQIIGRAIRYCSHNDIMSESNQYPKVNIYKYIGYINNDDISSEESIYKKAEIKYKTVKQFERIMKETAVDCPLNYNGNVFSEEYNKYKNCEKTNTCPAVCDFTSCKYTCDDTSLNKLWNPKKDEYNDIPLEQIDHSTFNISLQNSEIKSIKNIIKELYLKNFAYTLKQIIDYVKKQYENNKIKLFDKNIIYKALTEFIPITENDFNNYLDILYDKYHNECYLIQRKNYYILQRFDISENVLMKERKTNNVYINHNISLENYITDNNPELIKNSHNNPNIYIYDTIYYKSRLLNNINIIINGKLNKYSKKKSINDQYNINDIRISNNSKNFNKLTQGINIYSKSISYLNDILKYLNINKKSTNKKKIINLIITKLLDLEKNSKGLNKKTYIQIPINHKEYVFPYNLEDRIEFLKKKINTIFSESHNIIIKILNNKLIMKTAKINDSQHAKLIKLGSIYRNQSYYFKL